MPRGRPALPDGGAKAERRRQQLRTAVATWRGSKLAGRVSKTLAMARWRDKVCSVFEEASGSGSSCGSPVVDCPSSPQFSQCGQYSQSTSSGSSQSSERAIRRRTAATLSSLSRLDEESQSRFLAKRSTRAILQNHGWCLTELTCKPPPPRLRRLQYGRVGNKNPRWRATLQRLAAVLERPSVSDVSPYKKHTVMWEDAEGDKVRHNWHYVKLTVPQLRALYNGENPGKTLSFASMYRCLRVIPWAKKASQSVQQLVCCCQLHVSFRWLLEGLQRLTGVSRSREDVLVAAMCDVPTLECVESQCAKCKGKFKVKLTAAQRRLDVRFSDFTMEEYDDRG